MRDWQLNALRAWAAASHRGVIEAVTGAGKTMPAIHAIQRVLSLRGQVLVLVPTVDLINQWAESIVNELGPGAAPGLRGNGDHASTASHTLVISTIQSVFRHPMQPLLPVNLLVVDEVHRMGADAFGAALDPSWGWRLGLTATWERPDLAHELILAPYFGGVVFSLDYRQAHDSQSIAPFDVYLAGVPLGEDNTVRYKQLQETMDNAKGQLQKAGALRGAGTHTARIAGLTRATGWVAPIAMRYMQAYSQRNKLLGACPAKLDALAHLAPAVSASQRTLVFAQTIQAAKDAAKTLEREHVDTEALWGGAANKNRRRDLLRGFAEGRPKCLCTPKILDEGVDVPAADLGIIMAASGSQRQMIQRMGRVLRPKEGKRAKFVIIYCTKTIEDPGEGSHKEFLDQVRRSGSFVHGHIIQEESDWESLVEDLIA